MDGYVSNVMDMGSSVQSLNGNGIFPRLACIRQAYCLLLLLAINFISFFEML